MNPFANLQVFEGMRTAALAGENNFASYLRSQSAAARGSTRSSVPIQMSARTLRMVRLAIASSHAVLLVGPPGTGKTEILRQVIDELAADPVTYGFDASVPISSSWMTPEEEWTFDKIVMGETVVGGEIVTTEGALLEAIRTNQWLVLDEVNRADMDRVLGGVLTWLSGHRVRVGTWIESGSQSRLPVDLDWSTDPSSNLSVAGTPPTRTYAAGADWRLLGTYNAVDAQRVFRMGQALGRRFKQVPIPPADATAFRIIMSERLVGTLVGLAILDRVESIYVAHLATAGAELGPGLFVDIPAYIDAGLRAAQSRGARRGLVPDDAFDDASSDPFGDTGVDRQGDQVPADLHAEQPDLVNAGLSVPIEYVSGEAPTVNTDLVNDLLAEAYVTSVGSVVSRFEPQVLDRLAAAFVDSGAFSATSWQWVDENLRTMQA